MAIQYLLVTFPDQRSVLANGVGVGVTNHMLMLPADEYSITLDGAGYAPASQDIALGGTSMVKPLVIRFEPIAAAMPEAVEAKGMAARAPATPPSHAPSAAPTAPSAKSVRLAAHPAAAKSAKAVKAAKTTKKAQPGPKDA